MARAERDRVRARVGVEHVERLGALHGQAAALADGVVEVPAVAAQNDAFGVQDVALAVAQAAVAGEEALAAGAGQEAEVL